MKWWTRVGLSIALGVSAVAAHAVPSFSRQTGSECVACHAGGMGPQLTAYGIRFKLSGYTDNDGQPGKVPLSARIQYSAYNFNRGEALVRLDQAAIQLAGRLTNNVGAYANLERTTDNSSGVRTSGLRDRLEVRR